MSAPKLLFSLAATAIALFVAGPAPAQRPTPAKGSGWDQRFANVRSRAPLAAARARSSADGSALRLAESEPNDGPSTATAITPGDTIDATIATELDVDFYRMTLTAGSTVIVDIDAQAIGSTLDAMVGLIDPSGATVAYNDDTDGLDPRIRYQVTTTGTYYVEVRPYSMPGNAGAYRLNVRLVQPGPGDPSTLYASNLGAPWGLAAAPGRMYVVDRVNKRLQTVTASGAPVLVSTFAWHPVDVVLDGAGTPIVVGYDESTFGGRAVRVAANGSTTPFATTATPIVAVTVGPDGDVWMGINIDTIARFSAQGVRKATFVLPDQESAMDLAFSPSGVLHVATYFGVYRLNGGSFTRVEGIESAVGLAFDADGYLYVSSYSPAEVRLYTPAMTVQTAPFALSNLDGPFNLAFTRDANGAMTRDLLVANAGSGPASSPGTIVRLNSTGVRAVGARVGVDIPTILIADAAAHLMGGADQLTTAQLNYLDMQGNRNGRYDIGDFRAFVRSQMPPSTSTSQVRP